MGSFGERLRILSDKVGRGKITAKVTVDQVYARRQHQEAQYAHPGGGQAFYLRDALNSGSREHLQRVAMYLYDGNIQQLFISYANKLAEDTSNRTPKESGALSKSGRAEVLVGGAYIYRRPATVGRMSKAQLNARHRPRRH